MKNIYLPLHIVTWDGWTKSLTKLQGEWRMVRKRLTPKSEGMTLYAFALVWFSVISPREHRYLWKESEDRLPMVLTTSGKTSATIVILIYIFLSKISFKLSVWDDLVVWCEKRSCRIAWMTSRWVLRSAIEFMGDILTMTMGFVQGRRSRYYLLMPAWGWILWYRSETISEASGVFDLFDT